MNVLWVSQYPVFGGPHNTILQLAEPLRARGWESIALLPEEPGNAAERLRAGGVETVLLPLHRLQASRDPRVHLGMVRNFRREVAEISELISERQCELVVLTGIDAQAAVAARRASARDRLAGARRAVLPARYERRGWPWSGAGPTL